MSQTGKRMRDYDSSAQLLDTVSLPRDEHSNVTFCCTVVIIVFEAIDADGQFM